MTFFCTTPKAENGQPTVKCRDYLIFQATKCSRATFSIVCLPSPLGELTDPLGGVEGFAVPPQEPYPVRALSSLTLTLQLFGPPVTDPPVTD